MFPSIPYSAGDLVVGFVFALMALGFFAFWWRFASEKRVLLTAVVVKLLSSVVSGLISIYYYEGVSDALSYHENGVDYAATIRSDLLRGTDNYLSAGLFFWPSGISTARFESLSGLLHFLLFDSFLACSFFFALMALVGQIYLYRVFIAHYPDRRLRLWWQVSVLFFPTFVFWSSGLLKDTLGIYGLGCAVWGTYRVMDRRIYGGLAMALFGAYVLLLFRAQVLAVLFLALLAPLLVSQRLQVGSMTWQLSGLPRFLLLACGVLGVSMMMMVQSKLDLSELPRAAKDHQQRMAKLSGDSTLDNSEMAGSSWLHLGSSAPLALVITLYRPFLWEARGATALLGALENLVLLLLSVRALLQFLHTGGRFGRLLQEPLFPTCLVFVILFGVGIGVSTPNLGTLSRYRIPLIPFFAALLIIMESHTLRFRERLPSPARTSPSGPPRRLAVLK
ncbi:MAG: hypothetical protein ACRELG_27475 [Gemmataceae bacterium]